MIRVYRNIVILMLITLSGIILFPQKTEAGWPFNKTPPIEGVVRNAKTGKPIENVVVSCGWVREVDTPGGTVGKTFDWECSITDNQGKYHLPGKTSFHIFSKFRYLNIQIFHPLYASKMGFGDNTGVSIDQRSVNKSPDGIVHYDVELLSLEEKYSKPEDNSELSYEILSHANAGYFINLKQKYIKPDIEKIFSEWERLGQRFPEEKHFSQLNDRIKDAEERILKKLKEIFPEE